MEPERLNLNNIEGLFKSHYKALCNTANRIIKDRDAAEDIVQDVFIKLWNKKDEINIDSSIKGYLFKAITNASLNYLESNKISKFKVEIDHATESVFATDESNDMVTQELAQRLEQAIDALPPKCKAIFVLSRYEEMKYQEIATHLDISIKTVENQMGIALEKIRTSMAPYLKGEFLLWPLLLIIFNMKEYVFFI
jgi:RNA polymerase sigma-70 factor (ECF subfamily)